MVPHHPKIIIFCLPTWAIPEKCERQERISLEGKGGTVWNFLTFFQNVVTVNRRLKLRLAKLLTHSSCCLGATGHEQLPVEGFPSLHLKNNNNNKKKKPHKNGVSMPNSLSPAWMDHCSFLDCASLWEKNLKMVLFRVQQFQHQWKQFTVSQKLQWNRLEYYVNHLSI